MVLGFRADIAACSGSSGKVPHSVEDFNVLLACVIIGASLAARFVIHAKLLSRGYFFPIAWSSGMTLYLLASTPKMS